MKRDAGLAWLWHGVRVTMGFLFLLAAAGKLRDPIKFMGGMDQYGLVHGWILPIGAVVMPGVELLSALCLLLAWRVRAAAMLVSGMLLLFVGAMGSALYRKLDLDCSCFDLMGADPALLAHGPVVRDLVLTGLLLAFRFLGQEPSDTPRPRLWRTLLMAALFTWIAFSLLAAGSPAWHTPTLLALYGALGLWLAFDLAARGWATLRWRVALRDALILGPLAFAIFHVLGDGQANLGWGTILRDVSMVLPSLWLVVYGPDEA